LCKRRIEDFYRAQIAKFVSFTGAFTCKYAVKSVKEACKTVHSTPKETCQYATQFDRPCKTACFWWVKETPKDAQECDLGLCEFVGYFHVFPSSHLRRRNGLAAGMVIRIAIRGMAFANSQGIVACLPLPVNSHSHSHSLKIPWGRGGVNHSSHDFPAKKQETEQVVRNRML